MFRRGAIDVADTRALASRPGDSSKADRKISDGRSAPATQMVDAGETAPVRTNDPPQGGSPLHALATGTTPRKRQFDPVPAAGRYCIFQEPWWLDAVAPGAWQSLEVSRGEQLAARLPISLRTKFGFRIIRQPPLTPILGPWLRPSVAGRANRMADEKDLLNELIDQLPAWDYFEADCHPAIQNWLPFHWRGYQQTTRYTYVLDAPLDPTQVWASLQEHVRRNIRKAQRVIVVRSDLSLETLLDLVEATFRRQGQRLPFDRSLMYRVDAACTPRQARQMFFAQDAVGRLHAAAYVIVDDSAAYYLLGGADPECRSSGAQNLLLWEAIQFAAAKGLSFDFEGSMVESIERVFRGFGARQVPYLRIYAMRPAVRLLAETLPVGLIRALWRAHS